MNDIQHYLYSTTKILSISNFLEKLQMITPEYIKCEGDLIMVSLKSKFEIYDKTGRSYTGSYPDEIIQDIKNLHIGDKVTGLIEKNTIINQTTGSKKISYSLLKIKRIAS